MKIKVVVSGREIDSGHRVLETVYVTREDIEVVALNKVKSMYCLDARLQLDTDIESISMD